MSCSYASTIDDARGGNKKRASAKGFNRLTSYIHSKHEDATVATV